MCMQCMATAMAGTAAATGLRAWLGTRTYAWLTPARLKRFTVCLFAAALLAATVALSGAGSGSDAPAKAESPASAPTPG